MSAAPDVNDLHRAGRLPADMTRGAPMKVNGHAAAGHAATELPKTPVIDWIGVDGIFCDHPEPRWVVPELSLGPGRASCLAAYAGLGKTLTLQSLALSVATGRKVFGWYGSRKGKVRWVDRDQGRGTLRRFWRQARGMGIERDELAGQLEAAIFPDLNLVSTTDDEWLPVCDGFDLVVLDSLRAMLPGIDENDSQVQEKLLRLASLSDRTDCTFILIHHFGKGGGVDKADLERLRGSSGIGAGLGSVFTLTGGKDEPRLFQHQKLHGDASNSLAEECYLELLEVDDGIKPCAWAIVRKTVEQIKPPEKPGAKFLERKAAVLEFIRCNPGVPGKVAVRVRLGLRQADVSQAVSELLADGAIENRGSAKGPKLFATLSGKDASDD